MNLLPQHDLFGSLAADCLYALDYYHTHEFPRGAPHHVSMEGRYQYLGKISPQFGSVAQAPHFKKLAARTSRGFCHDFHSQGIS